MRTAATKVHIVNESALGIYVASWGGRSAGRCEISWFDGMTEPSMSFWISGRGCMSPPTPIRNPERFGWKRPKSFADVKAFALAFAQACEEDKS